MGRISGRGQNGQGHSKVSPVTLSKKIGKKNLLKLVDKMC